MARVSDLFTKNPNLNKNRKQFGGGGGGAVVSEFAFL